MKRIALGIVLYLCFSIQGLSSEIIPKIEESWNQITTMSGQFQQTDRDGSILFGKFYFLKPYKSKFIYTDKKENIVTNYNIIKDKCLFIDLVIRF